MVPIKFDPITQRLQNIQEYTFLDDTGKTKSFNREVLCKFIDEANGQVAVGEIMKRSYVGTKMTFYTFHDEVTNEGLF